jgi:hypothetical protein
MVSSANVISANLETPEQGVRLTKDQIAKQEAFLKKEKERIALEESMMAQQEKLKQEMEAKQKAMVQKVVEKVKKQN